MNIQQIIKAAIPDADETVCDWILWGRLPYPFAKLTAKDIYKAAHRFKRVDVKGKRLCDLCDKLVECDNWTCDTCKSSLSNAAALEEEKEGR